MKSSMPNCRSCRLQQVVTLKFDTGRHVQKFEAGYLKCGGTPSFFLFFCSTSEIRRQYNLNRLRTSLDTHGLLLVGAKN
jgi:hypothetical protein